MHETRGRTRRTLSIPAHEDRIRAGHWLRMLRELRGFTQRELALKVGIEPYTVIAQIESGRGCIPAGHRPIWAKALGVPAGEFERTLAAFYDGEAFVAGATPAGLLHESADAMQLPRFKAASHKAD